MSKLTPAQQAKVRLVLDEFKKRKLHSGSKHGPRVVNRKQAIAIAMQQAGAARRAKK
jgi:hypothetical protein